MGANPGRGLLILLGIGHGTRDIGKKIFEVDLKRGIRIDLVHKGLPGKVTVKGSTAVSDR